MGIHMQVIVQLIVVILNHNKFKMYRELNIISYNCAGFRHRKYDYVNDIFKNCDILFLQETWLHSFEHKQYTQNIQACQYRAVSAMDDSDVGRVGRPYGGCAILWHRELAIAFRPINTTSPRICAVSAKAKDVNVVLINVYMPIDDNTDVNFDTFGDVLAELSTIINVYEGYDFILGGDLNVDFARNNSRNMNLLKQFLNNVHAICLTKGICNDNHTFENTLGGDSFIDHFIVNHRLQHCFVKVAYDGNNLSDHNPISLKTNIKSNLHYEKNSNRYVIDWNNATVTEIINYKILLNYYFEHFNISQSVSNCNDFQCKKHDAYISSKLDEFIDIKLLCICNHSS